MQKLFEKGWRLAVLFLTVLCLIATAVSLASCGKIAEKKNTPSVIICLTRHGETDANLAGIYSRNVGTPALTEAGKEQARTLGQAVSFIPFDRAFASEMQRTQETEKIILEENENPAPDIEVRAGFDEIAFGKADGMTSAEAAKTFGDNLFGTVDDEAFVSPTGGETAYTFAKRYHEAMTDLAEDSENAGKTLLVTGHSSAGWWLQSLWPDRCGESLKNGSFTVLKYQGGNWSLLLYNETDFTDFAERYKEAVQ